MNNHVRDVDGLVMGVQGSGDVGKPKEFFDFGKDDWNWFVRMITCLLDDSLVLEGFVRHYMPVIFL